MIICPYPKVSTNFVLGPYLRGNDASEEKLATKYLEIMLVAFCCFSYSPTHAATLRQDITTVKKQKEALTHEQKRLLTEVDAIGKMIEELSLLSEEKKETLENHQTQISKTLPLLARLGRSNPFRMVIDPTMGQEKVRGIVLTRFLVSSIKHKMQQVQENLNEITVKTNDLAIKSQSTQQLLQEIERQKMQLSLEENKKIKDWTKAELDRLANEEDPNTLLDESRATLSKTTRAIAAATAVKGLPFRRLEQPVEGKIFKDSALQNKFSPHSQGIFFETQKNALVCAPAKGKIVFKGPFRNQAEILIIDHGEMAHTILMGMDKINAEVGKKVYAGQKLGTMAGYGSGQPHLYLELLHKGKSIDPAPYFAMKNLE
jgi:septal ring factor EnvC (AmiA/AmiB activator)